MSGKEFQLITTRLTIKDSSADADPISLALWARYGTPPSPVWERDSGGHKFLSLGRVSADDVVR
jgi:hypothetical protein